MTPWDRPIVKAAPGTDYIESHAVAASEYILRAKLDEFRKGLLDSVNGREYQTLATWKARHL